MVKSLKGFETLFIVLLLSGISLFALSQTNIRPKFNFGTQSLPSSLSQPSPAPKSSEQISEVLSPDGKLTLITEKKTTGENVAHSFTIVNEDGSRFLLFSKTLPKTSEVSVPFNTFSPDNSSIFIIENDNFHVYNISDGTSINISDLFSQKLPELSLLDITGWAAPGLLIANTQNDEGVKRSYWFEVPSQNFIQLATGFY